MKVYDKFVGNTQKRLRIFQFSADTVIPCFIPSNNDNA